jgi:hypothetical protein
MPKTITLLTFLLIFCRAEAKEKDTIPKNDTSYYVSLRNKLTLYIYGVTKFSQFDLENNDNDNYLSYQPNSKFNLGLGFNYRWLGLSTTFNFNLVNDNELYGKTESFDIQSDILTRRTIISVNLQSYKGFYWENAGSYYPVWNKVDSFVIRPDIQIYQLGTNYIYTFNNDRFSFKTAFSKTGWQKKSAGSFLAGGFFSVFRLSADSSIVPTNALASFPVYDNLYGLSAFNIGASFGYAYTYVWHKKLFIHGTLMLGLLNQTFTTYDAAGDELFSDNNFSSKTHFRMAVGFNNDVQSYGISVVLDSYLIQNRSVNEFIYNYGKINLFYARRFDMKTVRKRKFTIEGGA